MTAPLVRPRDRSVYYARPLLEVLPDDAARCMCRAFPAGQVCSSDVMTVTAEEYGRDDWRAL